MMVFLNYIQASNLATSNGHFCRVNCTLPYEWIWGIYRVTIYLVAFI